MARAAATSQPTSDEAVNIAQTTPVTDSAPTETVPTAAAKSAGVPLIQKISADARDATSATKHAALSAIETALHELRTKVARGIDHLDKDAIALLKKIIGE